MKEEEGPESSLEVAQRIALAALKPEHIALLERVGLRREDVGDLLDAIASGGKRFEANASQTAPAFSVTESRHREELLEILLQIRCVAVAKCGPLPPQLGGDFSRENPKVSEEAARRLLVFAETHLVPDIPPQMIVTGNRLRLSCASLKPYVKPPQLAPEDGGGLDWVLEKTRLLQQAADALWPAAHAEHRQFREAFGLPRSETTHPSTRPIEGK